MLYVGSDHSSSTYLYERKVASVRYGKLSVVDKKWYDEKLNLTNGKELGHSFMLESGLQTA